MSKIIALDAGHGATTSGKRITLSGYDPVREWWLNDRIMDMVEKMLAEYDCTVLRVDDTTGKKDITLANRVNAANNANADVYISMHHNAGMNGRSGGGTVVYYCSDKSERLAQANQLYHDIVSRTGLSGNRSQKVINKGFYVIKNTKMPAFLVENGFMDSPDDVPVILSDMHAKLTADGVVAFLVREFGLEKKKEYVVDNKVVKENKTSKKVSRVMEWQNAAIKDGFVFPKYGADGCWGAECETIAKNAIVKKRLFAKYKNLTKIVQREVGVKVDGVCGKDTKAAIEAYQRENGLVADGCVGLNTWKKILGV